MVYQDTTYLRRRPALAAAAFQAAWRSITRAAIAFERQRRISRAIKIVSALDDHVLKDIGVPRGSIPEEARKVVDRDFRGSPPRWRAQAAVQAGGIRPAPPVLWR